MMKKQSNEKPGLPELFDELPAQKQKNASYNEVSRYRSYLLSPLIAAALPLKDVKKNLF